MGHPSPVNTQVPHFWELSVKNVRLQNCGRPHEHAICARLKPGIYFNFAVGQIPLAMLIFYSQSHAIVPVDSFPDFCLKTRIRGSTCQGSTGVASVTHICQMSQVLKMCFHEHKLQMKTLFSTKAPGSKFSVKNWSW